MEPLEKLRSLDHLVSGVAARQSKLVLLVGPPHQGKSALLNAYAKFRGAAVLNVGAELGALLAGMPKRQRQLQVATVLRELASRDTKADLVLLDNIELLFDESLKLDPLELLKRLAQAKPVLAVWPGKLQDDGTTSGRLTYADLGHPEHQDYSLAGLVTFAVS